MNSDFEGQGSKVKVTARSNTLDNKDVASLTLLGVSYRFLASDHENHC